MPFEIPAVIPGAVAAVAAILALFQVFGMRRCWRERRRFAAVHRSLWLAVFVALALLAAGLSLALTGYRRLTAESPVATLAVQAVGPQEFDVRVDFPDGRRESARLHGDEWQLDARVIKWTPRAVTLGAEPLYRVERLSGRFRDVEQARATPPSIAALGGEAVLDLWQLKKRFPDWLPFVDADYGSAAYLPLVDGTSYRVTLATAGGLVARPADTVTEEKLRAAGW